MAPKATAMFLLLAGLMGAAGTAVWASGSHGGDPVAAARLTIAGQYLLMHAIALCAGVALARTADASWLMLAAMGLLAAGSLLFSGDVLWRVWQGERLFAFAAPLGGLLTIAGWLALAAAGITLVKRY
ncbi:MAG: DUF423 domain-containing protein [Alphaproteobacteria bacterium]|nr:DUF423 domain-containing protein [Alphaproteobacteria bacterium]